MIQPAQILISAPSLEDAYFNKAVICIVSCNHDGAMGFVINQPHPRRFNELVAYRHCKPLPLYLGGPVETDQLYVLHCRPDCIDESDQVTNGLYLGGNFAQTVAALQSGDIKESELKLFTGYCGWDADELEAEIAAGSWLLCAAASSLALTHDADGLWEKLQSTKH